MGLSFEQQSRGDIPRLRELILKQLNSSDGLSGLTHRGVQLGETPRCISRRPHRTKLSTVCHLADRSIQEGREVTDSIKELVISHGGLGAVDQGEVLAARAWGRREVDAKDVTCGDRRLLRVPLIGHFCEALLEDRAVINRVPVSRVDRVCSCDSDEEGGSEEAGEDDSSGHK